LLSRSRSIEDMNLYIIVGDVIAARLSAKASL